MDNLHHINSLSSLSSSEKKEAINALESGKVIFLPNYFFNDVKDALFTEELLDRKHKNISFDFLKQRLGGCKTINEESQRELKQWLHAYAIFAQELVIHLFPCYKDALKWGRTSYRPAEIANRITSKRKDDTRLHVDSFAASPVQGQRILRIFCNINPNSQPRVWYLGQPFSEVMQQFHTQIPNYNPFLAKILKFFKITKSLRSAYDHYQLHLHDRMKLNDKYQSNVEKQRFDFPALSTWIVFTDQVSHAALSGQYLLEQTFYLPVEAMTQQHLSPLRCWEKEKQRALV